MDFQAHVNIKIEPISSNIDASEDLRNNFLLDVKSEARCYNGTDGKSYLCLEKRLNDYDSLLEYGFEECHVCRSVFPNKYSRLKHNLDHLKILLQKLELFQCHDCSAFFLHKKKLRKHIMTEHKTAKNILKHKGKLWCCNRFYKYKNWHDHFTNIHNYTIVTCAHCNKTFRCKKYLRTHIKNVHFKLKTHSKFKPNHVKQSINCNLCAKSFSCISSRNTHVRNCHSKTVQCEICKSLLKSPSYLKTHMLRVHTYKQSQCSLCHKTFKNQRRLKVHIQNAHKKLRLECQKCGKAFNNDYLNKHIEICKGTVCDRKLRRRKNQVLFYNNNIDCNNVDIGAAESIKVEKEDEYQEEEEEGIIKRQPDKIYNNYIKEDNSRHDGVVSVKVERNDDHDYPLNNNKDTDCKREQSIIYNRSKDDGNLVKKRLFNIKFEDDEYENIKAHNEREFSSKSSKNDTGNVNLNNDEYSTKFKNDNGYAKALNDEEILRQRKSEIILYNDIDKQLRNDGVIALKVEIDDEQFI